MKKLICIALAALMALAVFAGCGEQKDDSSSDSSSSSSSASSDAKSKSEGTVSTDGSTSMEKVIGALGEAFEEANKGISFTYNPTGSGSGIEAVTAGRCDIGLSSRALKDDEKSKGLKETTLALDGIAIIVNPQNSVSNLSLDDITKIYKGEVTNWKDVGGTDGEIVLIGCH